jgi:hypothetical protein
VPQFFTITLLLSGYISQRLEPLKRSSIDDSKGK